jgi:uncharacterized protein YlxW (UPF0749 family)
VSDNDSVAPKSAAPDPGAEAAAARRRRIVWRVGTPLVVLLSGALFAVSAANSEGTDLRPGRYTDLASLVDTEAKQYEELQDRVDSLNQDVAVLTEQVNDAGVRRYQREIAEFRDPAGLEPREGPGVIVKLSDAPEDVIEQAADDGLDLNLHVVHQQDVLAVVNAMWAGGATAITIEGQRVITTTGFKCEGNAIQLQGVPYPQPFDIEAVGDPEAIQAALDADPAVAGYREDAEDPRIQIGWELEVEDHVEAPAYAGLLDVKYAEPLPAK